MGMIQKIKKIFNIKGNQSAIKQFETFLQPTEYLESLYQIPSLKGTNTRFNFYRCRITNERSEALYSQGFRPFNRFGIMPTHSVFLICKLAKEPNNNRYVFNIFLDLSDYKPLIQEWILLKFYNYLKKDIISTPISLRGVLIPCSHEKEYPFCKDQKDIESYWVVSAALIWNRVMQELEKLAVF